jgi:hypothetical protein
VPVDPAEPSVADEVFYERVVAVPTPRKPALQLGLRSHNRCSDACEKQLLKRLREVYTCIT